MEKLRYKVVKIDGDYAVLRQNEIEHAETKLVARALLPPDTDEGSWLDYEWFQYQLIKEEEL